MHHQTLNASYLLVQPRLITDIQRIYTLLASKRERASTHTVYVLTSPVRCWHIVIRPFTRVHDWFHARTERWRYEDFPAQHRAKRDVKVFSQAVNFASKREQSTDAGANAESNLFELCWATRRKTIVKLVWIAEPTLETRAEKACLLCLVRRRKTIVHSEQSQDRKAGLMWQSHG